MNTILHIPYYNQYQPSGNTVYIAERKESASLSRRHETGNAHQRVNQKKTKGMFPVQKGEKY